MLQQILDEMFIDPEILAELSEEQTQVLYYKMREEQIKRYNIWAKEDRPPPRTSKHKNKKVGFQTGRDGDVLVWVMGDHRADKPYEQLVEEVRHQEATRIAEDELRAQREEQEVLLEEKQRKLREEEERLAKVKAELGLKWKRAEAAALLAKKKEARRLAKLEEEKIERERKEAEREEGELKAKENALKAERERRSQEQSEKRKQLVHQRSEDIYMSASQVMSDQVRLAQEEREKVEQIWQVQLRKIKLADKERTKLARRARDEVRQSRISLELDGLKLDDILAKKAHSSTQSTKPKSRDEVIAWYKDDQLKKGAGMVKGTRKPEVWFHGCINRTQAASLLSKKKPGSFLIRLSEKVWGYALSYKDDGRVKHFLIDATDSYYRFFGADQLTHMSLTDLVKIHKDRPITHTGQEILRQACGQSSSPPDYQELME